MEVMDLKHQAPLLSGSDVEECDGEYCDELGLDVKGFVQPRA